METEGTEKKKLAYDIETKLNDKQRKIYFDELNKRRTRLVESGEGRNVPYDERQQILEDVREGKIQEYESPFPNVDPKKMERDFEAAGRPMKGAKDD